ncbi:MAG: 3-oxoacyl-ACP synthase [Proteobacteria bacterium]|nr:3-oxoacyl-ACP synthase [Pseudomonadota bacterium]
MAHTARLTPAPAFPTPMVFAGMGVYRPREQRSSTHFDALFVKPEGWTQETLGIGARGVAAPDETTSAMGAEAVRRALLAAGWAEDGFDVLIGACAVMEQPIPGASVLIQEALGLGRSGIPAFDVNLTCLSFLSALDIVAMGFAAGRWRRAVVVSSDIASAGLDESDPVACAIFGDGAAAVCLERGEDPTGPALLATRFETYGHAKGVAALRAGGSRLRPQDGLETFLAGSKFEMDAFAVFKAAAKPLPVLIDRVLADAGLDRESVDLIVPHQASRPAIEHLRRLFPGDRSRIVDIFTDHGNQIAASMPSALHQAWSEGRLGSGKTALLLGTAAGISLGAMAFRF